MRSSPTQYDDDDDHRRIAADALERLRAMRSAEEDPSVQRCRDYHTPLINAACRTAMIDWCLTVVDGFDLSRESVAVSLSLLDRYLSSGRGRSGEALESRQGYQRAHIAAFFLAVKMNEPACIGIDMLMRLCRGFYKREDVLAVERDVLFALDWRVCASATTPMEYVRHYLHALLPSSSSRWEDDAITDDVLDRAARYMDRAVRDVHFATCRTSDVGAACLAGALRDADDVSSFQREALRGQLDELLDGSLEAKRVEERLLSGFRCDQDGPKAQTSAASSPETSVISIHEGASSSPVSVARRI